MPELPEVQTITSDLNKHLKGFTFDQVEVTAVVYASVAKCVGEKIENIRRIAKNIVFELESGRVLIVHLAMTGQLLLSDPKTRKLPWERITFILSKGDKKIGLKFRDMRMFGKAIFGDKTLVENLLQKYGPEPLDQSCTPQQFLTRLKSKKTTVKNALLDQKIVSGLGNIYATDALFMAKIHPLTLTTNLSPAQAETLLTCAKTILLEAIGHRGSTLEDKMYVDAYGKQGSHQNFFRIYGKKNCPKCNTNVEILKINGRGTYFCPTCQHEHKQLSFN